MPLTLRKFDPPSRTEIEALERELKGDGDLARQKAMLLAHDRKRGDGDEVQLADLLTQRHKLAVVGGAGSGKSTLLAYLAAMLCTGSAAVCLAQRARGAGANDRAVPRVPAVRR